MASLKRLICSIRGHEEYRHFDGNRVYLECVTCGRQSPGWIVENSGAMVPGARSILDRPPARRSPDDRPQQPPSIHYAA